MRWLDWILLQRKPKPNYEFVFTHTKLADYTIYNKYGQVIESGKTPIEYGRIVHKEE